MSEHEWVTFHDAGTSASGLTKAWRLSGSGGPNDTIGHVRWHGAWRQYVYLPEYAAILAASCMRQIAAFCDEQTAAQRERARPRR